MKRKPLQLDVPSLVAGLVAGAGIVVARRLSESKRPDDSPSQRRVNTALDRCLSRARKDGAIRLDGSERMIIFSDHHKGARNRADDFRQCEATYLAALDYYYEQGYTLIILGDAEELLEEDIQSVVQAYENVLRSEARFHPQRLIRLIGNHDLAWEMEEYVKQYMEPIFPGIEYRQGLLLEIPDKSGQPLGEIFLAHGHQGTLDSDIFAFLSKFALPFYRKVQILTGWGRTTPSQDACLRAEHDSNMYRWSSQHEKLILIAGHTHRPVWSSMTHLEKLTWELIDLLHLDPGGRPADYDEQLTQLKQEVKIREGKYPPCKDTIKTKPGYTNTGCCRFEDGDITGIELHEGQIRLVKWGKEGGELQRIVFEESPLSDLFVLL